ncbi:MAG TPA: TIGR03067 domain-containing protein [Candidatus Binatia bacterium]|nr:TIGR03067 domain-containing protein [Candidatus Binatia bacterium]
MDEELEKLQGEWAVAFLEVDGLTPAWNVFAGAKIVIEGDHFTSLGMGAPYEGILEVDASAVPKAFRMKFTAGPEKGNTNHGIYELDGDRWRICLSMTGGAAPTEFATSPGSGRALETLNREPKGLPVPEGKPPVILE